MRLVQLLGDGIEELYQVNSLIDDEAIKSYWSQFKDSEYESFEEFMNEEFPSVDIERMFMDIIVVE